MTKGRSRSSAQVCSAGLDVLFAPTIRFLRDMLLQAALAALLLSGCAREMPVWGVVFDEELQDQPYTRYTAPCGS
jgi:hypothetical protein